ncbi:glutamine synthetase family protein [Segetibacter aerophilus]|uniref:Glutamine synthetase n=1 Tax=Segetibacter aerophilus TaxID=670293 RepID=A0A512BCX3_9BACT|nr:glutamine synthetase family protein [Segetibacter aerophilus]GEO09820.1 glutamine synthetase [Segetibacter aerophilus]
MPDEINWKQRIENLETDKIKFAVTDIDGVVRGKIISKAKLLKGLEEGLGFCNVIFGWDINDVVYDNTSVSGWHTGYPDAIATIDVDTLRNIPWDDNTPFFLADFSNSKDVSAACPRTLLKRVRQQCLDQGFNPQFAKEFEWFNFSETSQSLKGKNYFNPEPFTTGMFGYSILRLSQNKEFYNDLFKLLQQFKIPLEGLHTETGDGVCEAAIDYTDILEAADRAVLFKSSVKEIASGHNLMACFMAKWSSDFPGCSGHIHQSLWNVEKNTNLFYDDADENRMSELLKHYVAGQLYCLPHILPMYAPTVNSYKRYVEGAWASTSVSWGMENRTTALRVINHNSNSMRLETRVPGADANPYLSLAASLASGLYGIENKLSLDTASTKGNEYANELNQQFPKTLKEATDAMKASDLPDKLFGAGFVDHFIKTREWEWKQFTQKVTDWELKRYFEIV